MTRVVLITGASTGIGKAIGEVLSGYNYKVYGTSRAPEKYPDSPFPLLPLDVLDTSSVQQCIDAIIAAEGRLDVLINNAGAGITGPVEETPESEMKWNFDLNFYGPVRMIKAVLPVMRKQNSGCIINVTSIAGYMGLPYRATYSASKAALEMLTESLSMEVKAFNIKVCCIAPGEFATNIAAGRYHAPVVEGSPYEDTYGKTLKQMNAHVDSGQDPLLMGQKIHAILQSENPRLHYKLGAFMQRFSIVLKRILPDRWYEKLLMNHYEL